VGWSGAGAILCPTCSRGEDAFAVITQAWREQAWRAKAAEARAAELEGALKQAASDFHEARGKLLDNTLPLWETQQFLIESKHRCLTVLGRWDDGPKETT
jgi:hypothetical protein